MKIIDFIRLVRKHLVLLIVIPVLLAALVILLTRKPNFSYTSQTVLYTGLATGSTIEMDKTFNYFLTNTAFDNLLNIINSRETQEEVAIRLLSQHLLLPHPDSKYISKKSYAELQVLTPAYIRQYVANGSTLPDDSTAPVTTRRSGQSADLVNLFPAAINRSAYEATVKNLTALMKSSDTNFVYKLLNYDDPHYSIKAISTIKALRINNSDLIKLSYEVDDPGICQQTLAIFNDVCIKNYKNIKENRSDEVVKYFEGQLRQANTQLESAEDKLLGFNKSNKIINYYEQSKAVAVVKEDMEVDYNNKKAQLAGLEAGIKRLEEKLSIQQQVQLKSNTVLDRKKQLGDINYEIAALEAKGQSDAEAREKINDLTHQADNLKAEIKKSIDDLYGYQNTVDGLPVSSTLNQWITNVVEAENLKAKLAVMDERNKEFQQQYSVYAPAGAHIKRIEREINVSEQGYLEILHGLNLAKLKLQDNEMSSDLRTVDAPYYPITPIPTKRKVLIIAAAMLGAILVFAVVLFMEYFDNSLKNLKKATATLQLPPLGMMPKAYLHSGIADLPFIQNRLLDVIVQNIQQMLDTIAANRPATIAFVSTLPKEGKTVLAANIASKLKQQGKRVAFVNYSAQYEVSKMRKRFSLLNRLLGYQDNRIDYNSRFLRNPATYLSPAEYVYAATGEWYHHTAAWSDIVSEHTGHSAAQPDYIILELPALLYNNYPAQLIATADMTVLTCRSNRIWSEADQTVLDNLQKLSADKLRFIINGVEIQETESLLGELPKKRSSLRRQFKNFIRFQFFSRNQF